MRWHQARQRRFPGVGQLDARGEDVRAGRPVLEQTFVVRILGEVPLRVQVDERVAAKVRARVLGALYRKRGAVVNRGLAVAATDGQQCEGREVSPHGRPRWLQSRTFRSSFLATRYR